MSKNFLAHATRKLGIQLGTRPYDIIMLAAHGSDRIAYLKIKKVVNGIDRDTLLFSRESKVKKPTVRLKIIRKFHLSTEEANALERVELKKVLKKQRRPTWRQ